MVAIKDKVFECKNFSSDAEAERLIDNRLFKMGINSLDINVFVTDTPFHEGADEIVMVFLGDKTTYVVVDNRDFDEFLIFKMTSSDYWLKWKDFIYDDMYGDSRDDYLYPEFVGNKQLIKADDYKFEIRQVPRWKGHNGGYGVYLSHKTWNYENMLCERWTVSECREWIRSHFIGRKGTKFNIEVIE